MYQLDQGEVESFKVVFDAFFFLLWEVRVNVIFRKKLLILYNKDFYNN